MSEAKSTYLRTIIVVAVIIVGLEYNLNASTYAILIGEISSEMLPIDMHPTQIGWIISLAAFFMIPGILVSGVLTSRMRMRNILIIAWVIYGLASVVLYWMHTTLGILVMRAIQGFAIGVGQPSSRALPTRLYGQESRGNILGLLSMAGGLLSMVVSFVFGRVALIDWRLCMFVAAGIALIAIIFTVIWVPNLPVEKQSEDEYVPKDQRRPFGLTTWVMFIFGFFIFVVAAVIQIVAAIHVGELGLGGTDIVAWVNMSCTFGIVVAGIFFGKAYAKLGKWLAPIALLGSAVFTYWFGAAHALWALCLSAFCANIFSIGTLTVYSVTRLTYAVPKERATTAVTILMMAWFLGQTLTTPWINWTEAMWGGTASVALMATGIGWGVMFIVSIIYLIATRNMKLTALEIYGRE